MDIIKVDIENNIWYARGKISPHPQGFRFKGTIDMGGGIKRKIDIVVKCDWNYIASATVMKQGIFRKKTIRLFPLTVRKIGDSYVAIRDGMDEERYVNTLLSTTRRINEFMSAITEHVVATLQDMQGGYVETIRNVAVQSLPAQRRLAELANKELTDFISAALSIPLDNISIRKLAERFAEELANRKESSNRAGGEIAVVKRQRKKERKRESEEDEEESPARKLAKEFNLGEDVAQVIIDFVRDGNVIELEKQGVPGHIIDRANQLVFGGGGA